MAKSRIFIDRRRRERRKDPDPCKQMPMDLYHRKRRKSEERRNASHSLLDDYQAVTADAETDDCAPPGPRSIPQ